MTVDPNHLRKMCEQAPDVIDDEFVTVLCTAVLELLDENERLRGTIAAMDSARYDIYTLLLSYLDEELTGDREVLASAEQSLAVCKESK